jgi:NAD(P)H-dependent FMN reductase
MKFLLISGTNRPQSNTLKLTRSLLPVFQSELSAGETAKILDLAELPADTFTPQSYAEKPKSLEPFIQATLEADAFFLVIPEYNGGAPGALKYFIDLLPFPESLQKRSAGFVGVAAGRFGNVRGVEQIEDVFRYRQAYVYPDRIFIPAIEKNLQPDGSLTEGMTKDLVIKEIKGFIQFTRKLRAGL